MGDLVLRTRIDIARSNLDRMCALDGWVGRGRRPFEDLIESINKMAGKTRVTLTQLGDVRNSVNGLADDGPDFMDLDEVVTKMRDIADRIATLEKGLREAKDELSKSARIASESHVALLRTQVERNDLTMLSNRANALADRLNADNYWAAPVPPYSSSIHAECESLFDEYVDLLRGMALREIGYGDDDVDIGDVFTIADRMPKLWAQVDGWAWGSVVLPSRMEQNARRASGMLGIGFPEWTVWALPLVQHDVGRMFVSKYLAAKGQVPLYDTVDDIYLGLRADACATIVTGPAYACAALLLRLDPQQVKAGTAQALRSATIVEALSAVTSPEGADSVLSALVRRLADEWRDAIDAASAEPEAFDQARTSSEVKEAVDAATRMLSDTSTVPTGKPFWATSWARITASAKLLKDDKAREINVSGIGDDETRPVALAFLLNAAWLARIGSTEPEEVRDADDIRAIARGALARLSSLPQPDRETRRPSTFSNLGGKI